MAELQARLLEYAQLGDMGGVEATLRGGAGLDATGMGTHPGRCAIHHAAAAGHVDVVKLLVSWGADTNLISGFDGDCGGRPAHLAAEAGFSRSLIELIQGGADINLYDANGYLPIHRATIFSRWRVLKVLQSLGYDLESRTFEWATPLHLAASYGDLWTVKWLVESGGVRVDLTDQVGYTALNQHSVQYHKEVYDYLAAVHYQMWDDSQSQSSRERQYHQSQGHFQRYADDWQQARQSRVYHRSSYRPKPYRATSNRTQAISKKETTGEALAVEASSTGASLTCPINNVAPEEAAEGYARSLDTSTGLAHQVSHSDSASQTDLTMIPQTEQIEEQHNIQTEDTQPNAENLITEEHSKSNKSLTDFTVRPSSSLNCPVVDVTESIVGVEKKVHTNGKESEDDLEVWERAIPGICDANPWGRREMEKTEVKKQSLDKVQEVNEERTEPQTLKQNTEHEVNGEVLLDSEKPEMKRKGPDYANSQIEPKINGGTEEDLNGVAGPEYDHTDKLTNGLATDQTQGGSRKEGVKTQEWTNKAKKNAGKVKNYSQLRKKRTVVSPTKNNKTEEAQHNGNSSNDIDLLEEQMKKLKIGEHDESKEKMSSVENSATKEKMSGVEISATNKKHQHISKTPQRLEEKEVVTLGKEFKAKSMHTKTRKSPAELLLKGVEVINEENEVETGLVIKEVETDVVVKAGKEVETDVVGKEVETDVIVKEVETDVVVKEVETGVVVKEVDTDVVVKEVETDVVVKEVETGVVVKEVETDVVVKEVETGVVVKEVETDEVVKATKQFPEPITFNGTADDHKEGKARAPTINVREPSADMVLEHEEGKAVKLASEDTVKELEKEENNIEENDQKERVGKYDHNTEDKKVVEVTCAANLDEKKTEQVTKEMKNEVSVKNESAIKHSPTPTQEIVREEAEGKYLEHDNTDKLHAQRETPKSTNSVPLTRTECKVNGTDHDGETNNWTTIGKGKSKRDTRRNNVKYTQVTPLATTNTEVDDGCLKEQESFTKDAQEDKPAQPVLEIQNNPEILATKKEANAELNGHDKPQDSLKTTNQKNEKSKKKKSKNGNEGQNRKSKRPYNENKEKEQVLNGNDINHETIETTIKTTLQETLKEEDSPEVQQGEKSIAKAHEEKTEEKLKEAESIAEVNCVKEKPEDKVMEKAEKRAMGNKSLAEAKVQDTNKESPLEGDDAQDIKHSTPSSKPQAVEDVNKHTKESNGDESKAKTEVAEASQQDKDSKGQPLEKIELKAKSHKEEPKTNLQLEPVTELEIVKSMIEPQVTKSESQIEKPMPKPQKKKTKTEPPVEKHEPELKTEPMTVLQTKVHKVQKVKKPKTELTVEEPKRKLQQEPKADPLEEQPQVETKTAPQIKEKVNHKADKLQEEDKTSEDTKEPGFTNDQNSHSELKPKDDLAEYISYSGKKKKKSKKARGQKEINDETKSVLVTAEEDVARELLGDDLMESLSNGEDGMTTAEDHDVVEEYKACESEEAVESRESEEESETEASHDCLEIKSILKEPKDAVPQEKDTSNDYSGKGQTEEPVTKGRLKCVDLIKKVSFVDPSKETAPKTQEKSQEKRGEEKSNTDDIAETPSGIVDIAEGINENKGTRRSARDTGNAKATPANLSKTKKRERRKKHKQHLDMARINSSFSEEINKIKENNREKTKTSEDVKAEQTISDENGIEKSKKKATSPKMPRKANIKETETSTSKKAKRKRRKATQAESDKQEHKINDVAKDQMAVELKSQETLEGQAKGNTKKEAKQGKKNLEKSNKNKKKMNETRKVQTAEHKHEPDADSSSTNLVENKNLLNDAGPISLTEKEIADNIDTKIVSPKVADKELSKKDQGPEVVVEDAAPEIGVNIRDEKIKPDGEFEHCQAEGKVSEIEVEDLKEEVNDSTLEVKEVEEAKEEVKVPEENAKDPEKKVEDPEEKVNAPEETTKDPEDVKGYEEEVKENIKGPEEVKDHVAEFKDPTEEVKDHKDPEFKWEDSKRKEKSEETHYVGSDEEIEVPDIKLKDQESEAKKSQVEEKKMEVTKKPEVEEEEMEHKKPKVEKIEMEDSKKPKVEGGENVQAVEEKTKLLQALASLETKLKDHHKNLDSVIRECEEGDDTSHMPDQECDLSYMTSVVQCLGHLPGFADLLTPYSHRSENESSCEMTEAVTQAMKELAAGVHTTTTPAALHHLKAVVEAQESIIQGFTRAHPFTFLCDLLTWLHQELSQTNTTDQNSSSISFGGQSSVISRVFYFLNETRFACEEHGFSLSRTKIKVNAIQVRVRVHNTLCLQSLLLKPPRPETVEWHCPACQTFHTCRHQNFLASLPHVLIVRLIRDSRRDQQEKPSPFLCEHLDLQDLLLPSVQGSGKYRLEGVISEKDRGSDSVEFTAYCRRHSTSPTTPSSPPPPPPHSLPHHHHNTSPTTPHNPTPTTPPPSSHSLPHHHNSTPTTSPVPVFSPPHSSTWTQHIDLLERETDTNTVLADNGATILFFVVRD